MTMFCPDEERLSAWVDRGLAPVEDEFISTHLAACEACRRTVTIAFMVDRESPEALSDEGQHRVYQTVQGALAEPSRCVSDELLAAWLHDGLVPSDRSKVTDHLAECDDCRRAAALTRLSNAEPVSALGPLQESRALNLVLRSAGRDAFFSFWRVAAASLLVAVAATYVAIQWSGPPASTPKMAAAMTEIEHRPEPRPVESGVNPKDRSAFVSPSNSDPGPSTSGAAPEKGPAESHSPARFQALQIFETEGLSSPAPGRLSYGDVLKPRGVASVNIEGRAVAVLDEGSESRFAYAADAGAYVVELAKGRVFIDTAGAEQTWEIRRADRKVTLRTFRGRASAEADGNGLRVHVLKGHGEVGTYPVDPGRSVEVREDSSVMVDERRETCATLIERYSGICPRTLLVLRARAGTSSDDGPWRFNSKSKKAELLEGAENLIPDCPDPIRWVVIALDEPLKYASDMVLRAACGGSAGARICLWVGGQGGWHREVLRQTSGTSAEEWPLRELRQNMVPVLAGQEIRKIMIGVVQERGREHSLEVDGIEIRRVLD